MALTQQTTDYINTLAQQFGLDAKAMLSKAESDEAARTSLDVVPRATFSRELDKVRDTTKQEFDQQFKTWQSDYYTTQVLPRWNQREQAVTELTNERNNLKAQAAAYQAVYGTLEGFTPTQPTQPTQPTNPVQPLVSSPAGQPQYMTREDAAALSGTLAKEMTWVAEMHRDEFGKRLDVDEFERHVMAGKYSGPKALRDAYADFTKTARETKQAADQSARDARIREEAVKEYAVTHHLPVDNGAPAPRGSQFFRQPSKDETTAATLADPSVPRFVKDQVLRDEFTQGLNGAQLSGALFKS